MAITAAAHGVVNDVLFTKPVHTNQGTSDLTGYLLLSSAVLCAEGSRRQTRQLAARGQRSQASVEAGSHEAAPVGVEGGMRLRGTQAGYQLHCPLRPHMTLAHLKPCHSANILHTSQHREMHT